MIFCRFSHHSSSGLVGVFVHVDLLEVLFELTSQCILGLRRTYALGMRHFESYIWA